jgi:hypothetical protein
MDMIFLFIFLVSIALFGVSFAFSAKKSEVIILFMLHKFLSQAKITAKTQEEQKQENGEK